MALALDHADLVGEVRTSHADASKGCNASTHAA